MTKVLRCLSWVAVSSDAQAERESPEAQERHNREFIEDLGRYYPGYSGLLVRTLRLVGSRSIAELSEACTTHPEYADLVNLAKSRQIDAIVCLDRTRLGRTTALVNTLERVCLNASVVVVARASLPPTVDVQVLRRSQGRAVLAAVEASMAEAEVIGLVYRNEIGMRHRVLHRKQFPKQLPYGYRYHYSDSGEKTVVPDPETAPVVRQILIDWYLDQGIGMHQIAAMLTERGIPAPRGKDWHTSTLLRMIEAAERYAGIIWANHKSQTGREFLEVRGEYQPLISEAELFQIQSQRAERGFHRDSSAVVFAGVAYCAICQRPMTAYTRGRLTSGREIVPYVICKYNKPEAHNLSMIQSRLLDATRALLLQLRDHVDVSQAVDAMEESGIERIGADRAALASRMSDLDRQNDRLVDGYVRLGVIGDETFQEQMRRIERDRQHLKNMLTDLDRREHQAQYAAKRIERVEEFRDHGLTMLDQIGTDPLMVRQFLRKYLRIYVDRDPEHPRRNRIAHMELI